MWRVQGIRDCDGGRTQLTSVHDVGASSIITPVLMRKKYRNQSLDWRVN